MQTLRYLPIYASGFFSTSYQRQNIARLQHLNSLGLPVGGKSVLEVGAGVGDHTLYYLQRDARVVPVEGRPYFCSFIKQRLGIQAHSVDLDRKPEQLLDLGHFEIMHCYGLLYHLSKPARFLEIASQVCDTIFLETCVSCKEDGTLDLVAEPSRNPTQAIGGTGSRPSRQWVFSKLKEHFPHVYCPRTQPRDVQFPLKWSVGMKPDSFLSRAVFIASKIELHNPNLVPELPNEYIRL